LAFRLINHVAFPPWLSEFPQLVINAVKIRLWNAYKILAGKRLEEDRLDSPQGIQY
jgi:hypothetical protein